MYRDQRRQLFSTDVLIAMIVGGVITPGWLFLGYRLCFLFLPFFANLYLLSWAKSPKLFFIGIHDIFFFCNSQFSLILIYLYFLYVLWSIFLCEEQFVMSFFLRLRRPRRLLSGGLVWSLADVLVDTIACFYRQDRWWRKLTYTLMTRTRAWESESDKQNSTWTIWD